MARAGFGNPKSGKGGVVYLCPKCGQDMTSTRLNNKVMAFSCHKSAKKLPAQDGWPKNHENYDAGCDVTVIAQDAPRVLKKKD